MEFVCELRQNALLQKENVFRRSLSAEPICSRNENLCKTVKNDKAATIVEKGASILLDFEGDFLYLMLKTA